MIYIICLILVLYIINTTFINHKKQFKIKNTSINDIDINIDLNIPLISKFGDFEFIISLFNNKIGDIILEKYTIDENRLDRLQKTILTKKDIDIIKITMIVSTICIYVLCVSLFLCIFPIWNLLKIILTIICIITFIGLIVINIIINYTISDEFEYNILKTQQGGVDGGKAIKYQYDNNFINKITHIAGKKDNKILFDIKNFLVFITTIFGKLKEVLSSSTTITEKYTNSLGIYNNIREYLYIPFIYNIPIPFNLTKNIISIILFIILLVINMIILFMYSDDSSNDEDDSSDDEEDEEDEEDDNDEDDYKDNKYKDDKEYINKNDKNQIDSSEEESELNNDFNYDTETNSDFSNKTNYTTESETDSEIESDKNNTIIYEKEEKQTKKDKKKKKKDKKKNK